MKCVSEPLNDDDYDRTDWSGAYQKPLASAQQLFCRCQKLFIADVKVSCVFNQNRSGQAAAGFKKS